MASSSMQALTVFIIILYFTKIAALDASLSAYSASSTSSVHIDDALVESLCKSAPYRETCLNTFQISISIGININILTYLLHSLQTALSEAQSLVNLFSDLGPSGNIVETQKGAISDCQELHQITLSSLQYSVDNIKQESDVKAYLSAALTNKDTCLEGLDSATGPLKQSLINSVHGTYEYVSNALALASKSKPSGGIGRRLLRFPRWISAKDRRLLESSDDDYDVSSTLTVAQDGSGNFTTISDAISFAPVHSEERIIIFVRQGVYEENVEVPNNKTNLFLLGDGDNVTVIIGNRSVHDGWTTFRSATLAVSGEGFMARDISIENTAGPKKHQAVALRVNADLAAFYRCTITGYQDTLYVHSFRQFYRECNIYGTVDFIFGNAAVIFQDSNMIARRPLKEQANIITAQSRTDEFQSTGISIQNCSVLADDDLNTTMTKSYLGRPWRVYSRVVYIESYIDDLIEPAGWKEWDGDLGLDTLYYGEYQNDGPGSGVDNRVNWTGYHIMGYEDASNFTVSEFISGDEWLEFTSIPYDDGV